MAVALRREAGAGGMGGWVCGCVSVFGLFWWIFWCACVSSVSRQVYTYYMDRKHI